MASFLENDWNVNPAGDATKRPMATDATAPAARHRHCQTSKKVVGRSLERSKAIEPNRRPNRVDAER